MAIHVAILQQPYLEAVLRGRKTMESRLTRTAQPPHGMIAPGERIFLKRSGGAFAATARAGKVHSFDQLTPSDIHALRRRFNEAVGGTRAYWQEKRDARFATFIELRDVRSVSVGPPYKKSAYKAWFVLDEAADPVLEVPLSEGALRNGYVPVAARPDYFTEPRITLELPDGRCVSTGLYQGRRLRWRGWRAYFQEHGLRAGDLARFVREHAGHYRVSLIRLTDGQEAACQDDG